MGNGGELVVVMLLGSEGGEGGNEAMGILAGERETAVVPLPVEEGKVGWGMDIVTGVEFSKPDETVGRRAVVFGDVFAGESEGVVGFGKGWGIAGGG